MKWCWSHCPRTARRYSLNADCGLGAHNLTFDGTTGAIYYSSQKPLKAFSVQCEVSAHQAGVSPHSFPIFVGDGCHQFLSFSVFHVMLCGKSSLLTRAPPVSDANFNFGDFWESRRFFLRGTWFGGDCQSLRIGGSHDLWCQRFGVFSHCDILSSDCQNSQPTGEGFQLGLCAWGSLVDYQQLWRLVGFKHREWCCNRCGGLRMEILSEWMDRFVWHRLMRQKKSEAPPSWQSNQSRGPRLDYDTHYFGGCLSERRCHQWSPRFQSGMRNPLVVWGQLLFMSHAMWMQIGAQVLQAQAILLRPSTAFGELAWLDPTLFLKSSQMAPSPSILLNPWPSSLIRSSQTACSASPILVTCGVWGSFPGSSFPALHSMLMVRIKDSICWVSETFQGKVIEELPITAEELCRNKCRSSKRCSHFTWAQDNSQNVQSLWQLCRLSNVVEVHVVAFSILGFCCSCLKPRHSKLCQSFSNRLWRTNASTTVWKTRVASLWRLMPKSLTAPSLGVLCRVSHVCILFPVLHTLSSKGFGHMPSFEASRLGFVLRQPRLTNIGRSRPWHLFTHPKMWCTCPWTQCWTMFDLTLIVIVFLEQSWLIGILSESAADCHFGQVIWYSFGY